MKIKGKTLTKEEEDKVRESRAVVLELDDNTTFLMKKPDDLNWAGNNNMFTLVTKKNIIKNVITLHRLKGSPNEPYLLAHKLHKLPVEYWEKIYAFVILNLRVLNLISSQRDRTQNRYFKQSNPELGILNRDYIYIKVDGKPYRS